MTRYDEVQEQLRREPRTWLVTGAAGFIGSHLVETLLALGQRVVGLDDFSSGYRANLEEVMGACAAAGGRFRFVEGDIRDPFTCLDACRGTDYLLHQAAIGSVPRSIEDPLGTHATNTAGTLNLLVAARETGVRRVVYASSSAVYGDSDAIPAREEAVGAALSPYAVTKRGCEEYAAVFARVHGTEAVGLRYFNVFGARQDPRSAYAAVIPVWAREMISGVRCTVHGDGLTTRDFTWVGDVAQANVLAATAPLSEPAPVFNVGSGRATTLSELHAALAAAVRRRTGLPVPPPLHGPFRDGDVRHSRADVSRISAALGYRPVPSFAPCLDATVAWYVSRLAPRAARATAGVVELDDAHAETAA
jgi:UDP-N-acetylglucosamine 4-epimerase